MVCDYSYSLALKRRRFSYTIDSMAHQSSKAKLLGVKEKFGREIRVFETLPPSSSTEELPNSGEEPDGFYEFTAEDYYRVLATRKDGYIVTVNMMDILTHTVKHCVSILAEKYLKTRKLREAEEAARSIAKLSSLPPLKPFLGLSLTIMLQVSVRVRFPDNHTLEATFHPSETMQTLVDLLTKVVAQPDLPFYIYTTPPKKQIKDLTQDFYSAGFVPGAIVYFSYDLPEGEAVGSVPYLSEDVMALKGLEIVSEEEEPISAVAEPETAASPPAPTPVVKETKPTDKKAIKPKWLKM